MRALEPTQTGFVDREGIRLGYEVFGDGERTVLLMPTFCVVHARIWKMQIHALARRYRVVTFDGPGNGLSDRSTDPARYSGAAQMADAVAVLDALGIDNVVVVASSGGTHRTLLLAAEHPDRVDGVIFIGPATPFGPSPQEIFVPLFGGDRDGFLELFINAAFSEPHSTKPIEDGIRWGQETTAEVLRAATMALLVDPAEIEAACAAVRCPVLVVQGTDDAITPEDHGRGLVEALGDRASLVLIEGGGHRTDVRDPARFTILAREFIDSLGPRRLPRERRWAHAARRPRRALFLSSPVGLGHARRDIAIAEELRALQPDLQIDWLAQHPVTTALEAAGEAVHPASAALVGQLAHFEAETAGHDLHCFQAWRGLDESMAANFMVLHDLLEEVPYDLVVADEAWEADHFLHENPELKRSAFAWLTDFVGWLPTADDDLALTADHNAQMLELIDRYPRVRDRALFVGNPEDVVEDPFGPGLPSIREWTEQHFRFPGYVSGFEVLDEHERQEVRAQLGWAEDEVVCLVTAGGSAVGRTLLREAIAAHAYAAKELAGLRTVVVAGPRIDPGSFELPTGGVEVHGFVPDLHRQLAASDVAVVQGGLTTAMELAAHRRPFLYFPLARHFEQQRHVPHRLDRYRAGRRMELGSCPPEAIAEALVREVATPVESLPVESDGARRAAAMLGELL